MAFSQAGISGVTVQADGPELLISWKSANPMGSIHQVYVERRLVWSGVSTRCYVPIPAGPKGRNIWVEVGSVAAGEAYQDFSRSLLSVNRAATTLQISWTGGTYLDSTGQDDVQGFRIYRSAAPGSAVDLSSPVDDVPAYPGGWISDGFGLGRFGSGGFGRVATTYVWTSATLTAGAWSFAVVPYDRSGTNRGQGRTVTATVASPPRPAAVNTNGRRLTYTYSGPPDPRVTLQWLASPST